MLNTSSNPTLTNCWFSRNESNYFTGGIHNNDSYPILINCVLWGNTAPNGSLTEQQVSDTPPITYSCVEGGFAGEGNISDDPLPVDADGVDDVVGTADDDLHLQAGSPCINAGSNLAAYLPDYDFEGDDRIRNCRVDLGVDETPYAPDAFLDCNTNGVDDDCDLYEGNSPDCNTNGVPDECDGLGFVVISVCSALPHGEAGVLCLEFGPGAEDTWIEPRRPGVQELICRMFASVDPSTAVPNNVQVNCVANAYGGDIGVSLRGSACPDNELLITFDPALPNQDCCEVTLGGMLSADGQPFQGSMPVRTLEGDLNRDGSTNTTDASQVKLRFGQTATEANCEWDFNVSGAINTTDYSQIKLRFGNAAPQCP